MQNHKGFRRFICVTVLCALLMVSMGRATRVSAVGTTAAIAGTAFILTGAVYLSYVALTQGEMVLPAAENMHNWLGSIGRKVSQYPSGSAAYQDIYQGLLRDPIANVIDGVWTWTQDRIKSFVNDFSDTRIISDIVGFYDYVDTSSIPFNGYDYPYEFTVMPTLFAPSIDATANQLLTQAQFEARENCSVSMFDGAAIDVSYNGLHFIAPTNIQFQVRNLLKTNGYYAAQFYIDGSWQTQSTIYTGVGVANYNSGPVRYVFPINVTVPALFVGDSQGTITGSNYLYPLFPQEVIHVQATDEDLPMVIPNSERENLPSWVDPDNNNRPIIPWVPIPDIPTGIPTPPGYTEIPQWGFPLQDLLDLLESLSEALINIGVIARLINEFAGQHGDNYYLEYNDGDTNYYTYYQPTIFDNDTEYVTYNIDISEQEEVIPVDLNTISLYTKNEYLESVKQSARHFGDAIGEYVAFWHNSDYTLTYTILGGFVLILIGAFIGKWGHS